MAQVNSFYQKQRRIASLQQYIQTDKINNLNYSYKPKHQESNILHSAPQVGIKKENNIQAHALPSLSIIGNTISRIYKQPTVPT